MVQVGDKIDCLKEKNLLVDSVIESGCFSTVFKCTSSSGQTFALKQSSASNLSDVQNEINLMYAVKDLNVLRVPRILDMSTGPPPLILMSLEPGVQLNQWLLANSASLAWSERIELAFALLIHLAPTFKTLHRILCHRDVNSHNILISVCPKNRQVDFTLIDLGLAVEKNSWDLYRWRDSPVSGDSRYWPGCAWEMLLEGFSSLAHEKTIEQYREKLDMHSFAITLVETICQNLRHGDWNTPISPLVLAWNKYWEHASLFARDFVDCSRNNGDWAACKARLARENVVHVTKCNLKLIRDALKSLRTQHQVFIVIERMLCVDEFTITADWSYVVRKLNIPLIPPRYGTPHEKNDDSNPLYLLRMHY